MNRFPSQLNYPSLCPSLFLVILALLVGVVPERWAHGADEPTTVETVRLQLKWRHQFQFAGYYAAIDQGYFREAGLAVELVEGKPAIDPIGQLVAGRVDYAIDSPAALVHFHQGAPIVAVAAIFQHSPVVVISRAADDLTTPQSFAGKRIMMKAGLDVEVQAMLAEEGISLDRLTIVPHTWTVEDLLTGNVDAQTAYISNEPYFFEAAGVPVTIINPLNYGIDFYGDCLFTTEDHALNNFEQIERFRKAVQQGWLYALSHPAELARLIHHRYAPEKGIDQLLFEAEAVSRLIQPDLVEIGHMNPQRWERIAQAFRKLGLVDSEVDMAGFTYVDIKEHLDQTRQRWITVGLWTVGLAFLSGGILALGLIVFNRRLSGVVRQRTASLAEREQHFRAFFELANVGVARFDVRNGRFMECNRKYRETIGYPEEELTQLTLFDITHPDDISYNRELLAKLVAGEIKEYTFEKRYLHKNGSVIWVIVSASPLWRPDQQPQFAVAVMRDISARKEAEERLIFADKVFEHSIEGIVLTDADGTIMRVNPAFTTITGYATEEAIGANPRILKSDRHPPDFYKDMWEQLINNGQWAGEIWNRRKNGEAYPEWLTINAIRNQGGATTHYVAVFHDISELKQQQEALLHLAHHDALTGLPNRILINDRLEMALATINRTNGKLALLYLDLDNFKHINDAFGHNIGDELLISLSQRLAGQLRRGDTMARLGGDEFLILLPELDHTDAVSMVAVRLIDSLKEPFRTQELELHITGSIGVTIGPDDGNDATTLIKNADIAMYRAKSLGRNNYQFFAPELDLQAHRRMSLELQLRRALEKGEFELFYQPLVTIDDGAIVGAEALIRWRHDELVVSPNEFIPLAEDTGLILPLGEWVIRTAAAQAIRWRHEGHALSVSVNLSPRQFIGQDLVTLLCSLIDAGEFEPGRFYFEVTESMVMGDLVQTQKIMGALRDLGIKFYLDDFGTGYSSLSYLKRLPIDGVKIDRAFIKDIVHDQDSREISSAIVSLANTLHLAIVAEGVETQLQRETLLSMGPMIMQGYLASRPVPASQLGLLLESGRIDWTEGTQGPIGANGPFS